MADWRTYAKAARNTARRQGADARQSAGVYAQAARRTAERQAPEVRRAAERTRDDARRTTAAYAAVTARRARQARLGQRLRNAFRDAVLIGLSLLALWFVITRTGVAIPLPAVAGVILVFMVVRFGYALFARTDTTVDDDNDLEGGFGERWERELDPRDVRPERDGRDEPREPSRRRRR